MLHWRERATSQIKASTTEGTIPRDLHVLLILAASSWSEVLISSSGKAKRAVRSFSYWAADLIPDNNSCRIKPMMRARPSLVRSPSSLTTDRSADVKSAGFRRSARDHTEVSTRAFMFASAALAYSRTHRRTRSFRKAREPAAACGAAHI